MPEFSIIEDDLKEIELGVRKHAKKKSGEFDVKMFKNSTSFFSYLNKIQATHIFKDKPKVFFSKSLQTAKRKHNKATDDYGFDELSVQ